MKLIEPTTGLDPDNRQHVWKIVQNLKKPSRLILMTTHSMVKYIFFIFFIFQYFNISIFQNSIFQNFNIIYL